MSSTSPVATSALSPSAVAETRRATAGGGPSADRLDGYGEQSFTFSDFLSIINPLQHIPIVGTIYRAITGDTINPAPKVIGGILFGGPMGLITSAFNAIVEQTTGKDLGEQALALVMPERNGPAPDRGTQFATLTSPDTPSASGAEGGEPPSVVPLPTETPPESVATIVDDQPVDGLPIFGRSRPLTSATRASPASAHGRTLSDYRTAAGRALPVIDNTRAANPTATPIRLQTTLPLDDRARASILPPTRDGGALEAASALPARSEREDGDAAADPFVAAMMRGLDRYREMKQAKPAPAVIDATL